MLKQATVVLASVLAQPDVDAQSHVKAALRRGTSAAGDAALDNDDRGALAHIVLAADVLRARLAHLLRCSSVAYDFADGDVRVALALYMIHESPWPPLPHAFLAEALSLSLAQLAALAAASPDTVRWPEAPTARLASQRSLPVWLAESFVARFGAHQADAMCAVLNAPGPVTLRVNTPYADVSAEQTVRDVAETLNAAGAATVPGRYAPSALRLVAGRPPLGVWSLPGWYEGRWEVQDEGSQLIALATRAQPGHVVLDMCAGNGGKTLALASMLRGCGRIIAYDVSAKRLAALQAAAARVGVAHCVRVCADEEALRAAVAEAPVDVVLVDAPCSSTGALRRRPHSRWAPGFEEEARAAPALQRRILEQAAGFVRPAGRLVYATCSLLVEENEHVAESFSRSAAGAQFEPWPFHAAFDAGPPLSPGAHEVTLLPHVHDTDGFYIARWTRVG